MPIYHGKLLELEAIEKRSAKTYLRIKLLFEEEFDIYLEVDSFTAKNINSFIHLDEKYKYRLSFNNYFDVIKQQPVSTLTKTYRDHSEKMSFSCSKEYISMLKSIKDIQHVDDLDKLTFISKNLEMVYRKEKEEILKPIQNMKTKNNIHKFVRLSFISLTAIFVIFFGYLSTISLSETSINENVLAQSIQFDNEVSTGQNITLDLDSNLLVGSISSNKFIVPFIELDEIITYSLPKGNVALTFDDGPSKYSMKIVDILKEYGIGGTFFFIGKNAESYPDRVRYVQSNGYSIGSHSTNHLNIPTLSYVNQESELIESIKLLEDITNTEINLFRPPYGSYTKYIKDLVHENNYKMVLWDNDPEDWKTRDSDKIFYDIRNSDISGSIIILHESQALIDALPMIIEYLQELNLEIVSLK